MIRPGEDLRGLKIWTEIVCAFTRIGVNTRPDFVSVSAPGIKGDSENSWNKTCIDDTNRLTIGGKNRKSEEVERRSWLNRTPLCFSALDFMPEKTFVTD